MASGYDGYEKARLALSRGERFEEVIAQIESDFELPHFEDTDRLVAALTHQTYGIKSVGDEFKALARHGDRAIYYFISRRILPFEKRAREQALKQISAFTSNRALGWCGQEMKLQKHLLHRGLHIPIGTRPFAPHSVVVADAFEALTGAIDEVHGTAATFTFLDRNLWSKKEKLLELFYVEDVASSRKLEALLQTCRMFGLPMPITHPMEQHPASGVFSVKVTIGETIEIIGQSGREDRALFRAYKAAISLIQAQQQNKNGSGAPK